MADSELQQSSLELAADQLADLLHSRWTREFYLCGGLDSQRIEKAAAEADRIVTILAPDLSWWVRPRLIGEWPDLPENFDSVIIERAGGSDLQPLIARMCCRAADVGLPPWPLAVRRQT